MSQTLEYQTLTFTSAGSLLEQAFTIPHGIASIAFQNTSGTIVRRNVTGTSADKWTLQTSLPQGFDTRNMGGIVIYFTGTEGAVLEISWITGILTHRGQ
jgi:hypothetical protein